jgi:hypothetical protein
MHVVRADDNDYFIEKVGGCRSAKPSVVFKELSVHKQTKTRQKYADFIFDIPGAFSSSKQRSSGIPLNYVQICTFLLCQNLNDECDTNI